ncbi:multicopper oxidase domain-containing protein [Desulfococcus sp.]|uniref:multicopper oxidase domain-containing protein n=1 Tax=Desulfococcus sp. TaxID=2025834 RepID=UPI003592F859
MNKTTYRISRVPILVAAVLLFLLTGSAGAAIDGISGTSFNLTARVDRISTADGGSVLLWGYANGGARAQYPGPTLIVTEGQTITVQLTNNLAVAGGGAIPNVSMVFPGQAVTVEGTDPGVPGLLTSEAAPGGTVTYQFTAGHPGTYMYHSGTRPELQVEMGLLGALIVRPSGFPGNYAYNHPDSRFDHEYLFLLSEMDPRIHDTVQFFGPDAAQLRQSDYLSDYFSNYWFINGRTAPDDMSESNVFWLPTQPYNTVPRMHPGERMLMRVIGGNRDMHPFHHHGNHARVIARDGRMLESAPGRGADLSYEGFTINAIPGETVDAIFQWTGKGLNWDIYGSTLDDPMYAHNCIDIVNNETGLAPPDGFADANSDFPYEYCADHNKRFPVTLPEKQDLAFGGWYSGSPFLGTAGALPPGEGGLNPNGGFSYMWHSHTEKELTNYDIFPGGMLTMLIIEAPGVTIP